MTTPTPQTELVERAAQEIHSAWCQSMRKLGWHGPVNDCTTYDGGDKRVWCQTGIWPCEMFNRHMELWTDTSIAIRQVFIDSVGPTILTLLATERGRCADKYFQSSEATRLLMKELDYCSRTGQWPTQALILRREHVRALPPGPDALEEHDEATKELVSALETMLSQYHALHENISGRGRLSGECDDPNCIKALKALGSKQ